MIRTKTTFVVGAGASTELALPSSEELLLKIGQSFDFSRLGTATQSRDTLVLAQYLANLASRVGLNETQLHQAADRLRIAARMGRSIDTLLDQHDTDPLVVACGKLAVVHFLCQAEAKSILRLEARVPGDLPIQGTETWLYQLGQVVTSGVPRSRAEHCLDEISIICFNYDRSIEHFLPHALVMAFGMGLEEARALVAERLRIIHPFGTIGRLPWQGGDAAAVEWGVENPANIPNLAAGLRTADDVFRDDGALARMQGLVANARRVAFLGFGYHPQNMDMLFGADRNDDAEVIASTYGLSPVTEASVIRMLRRRFAVASDDSIFIAPTRANELMRDYVLLLES